MNDIKHVLKSKMPEVIEKVLGIKPKTLKISKLNGIGNENYSLMVPIGRGKWGKFSIKIYSGSGNEAKRKLLKEVSLFRLLRRRGIGTPEVLYADIEGRLFGRPFILKRWIDAVNSEKLLDRDETRYRCLSTLADVLANMHSVPLEDVDEKLLSIPQSEYDYVKNQIFLLNYLSKIARLDITLLLSWLKERAPPAERYTLVHGDYSPENVLMDQHMRAYLIDLESVEVGDPVCDLGYAYHFLKMRECMNKRLKGLANSFIALYERRFAVDADVLDYYKVLNALKLLLFFNYMRKNLFFIKKFTVLYPIAFLFFLRPAIKYLKEFVASRVPKALTIIGRI